MRKIIINNCPACEPINQFINKLIENKFELITERIEDYHFHQLYFHLEGDLSKLKNIPNTGMKIIDGKFICECHWSTVELTAKTTN